MELGLIQSHGAHVSRRMLSCAKASSQKGQAVTHVMSETIVSAGGEGEANDMLVTRCDFMNDRVALLRRRNYVKVVRSSRE